MKKYLMAVLALAIMLIACAAAEEPVKYVSGDFVYILLEDGTAVITDYTGDAAELAVPETLDGYRVTRIGDYAFELCDLKDITIPDSVTSIGDYAFSTCMYLASITIPDSVTSIGECAFFCCMSLTSIAIPDSVTQLDWNPFAGCLSLASIHVNPSHPVLETIDGVLFNKTTRELICCPNAFPAASYVVPDGIRSIGGAAFYQCQNLRSITLPASVTSIGDYAFAFCFSLTSMTIPEGVTDIGEYVFSQCVSLTTVVLPTSVTSIHEWIFYDCSDQVICAVPMNSYAEQWCKENGISYVYGNAKGGIAIASGDFLYFLQPDQTAQLFGYTGSARQLILPAELDGYPVVSIAEGAFAGCADLTSVTIPDSVTMLEGNPFRRCGQLSDVWVSPDHPTLAVIGGVLFDKTEKQLVCCPAGLRVSAYAVPGGIRSIGEGAFDGCTALTSITLPDSVTAIGKTAFDCCTPQLTLTVSRDSCAAQWCREHQVRYVYPDANSWLLD